MASIKHKKTNTIADWTQAQLTTITQGGPAPLPPIGTTLSQVTLPSDWNDEHDISGLIQGTLAATQVAFGSGTDTITGDADFTYDGTYLNLASGKAFKGQYTNTAGSAFINPDGSAVFASGALFTDNIGNLTLAGFKLTTAPSNGYVLTSDGSGNGTWQPNGTLVSVTGTAPIVVDNTDPNNPIISITQSSGSTDGYLSSTDWNIFNNKQAAGNYITALTGDGTASGPGSVAFTLATVNGNVGSFGSSTAIPSFTVNAKGLITAAATNAVIAPAGTLTGTTLASNVVTSSLTTVGTISSGTWQGSVIAGQYGGTGVANTGKTITLGGNLTTSGAFASTFTMTGTTTVTFPTTGTLATLAGSEVFTNKTGTSATNNWFTLTTTGTSGAATYTSNTLNIPQYQAAGTYTNTVTNSDSTLTISPTSGNVVASLNLAHANTWTAKQTLSLATTQLQLTNGSGTTTFTTDSSGNFTLAASNGTNAQFFLGAGPVTNGMAVGGTDVRSVLTPQKINSVVFAANTDPGDAGRTFVCQNNNTSNAAGLFSSITLQANPNGSLTGGRILGDFYLVRRTINSTDADFYISAFRNTGAYVDYLKIAFDTSSFTGNLAIQGLTASRAVVTDGSKILTSSATTATEIGFVSGVTSAIQTQLNGKQAAYSNFTSTQVMFGDGTATPAQSSRLTFNSTTGKTLITASNGGDYGLKVQGGRIYLGGDATGVDFGIFGKDSASNLFFDANVVGAAIGFYTNDGSGNTAKLFISAAGAITTGLWNGTVIAGQYGGTGVANTGKTITLGGNLTTSGAFASTFTMTGTTTVTFPTSGTLLTSAGAVTSITGTANQVIASASTGAVTLSLPQSIATTSNVTFGSVTHAAGTTGQAPLLLTAGTNLTTPAAGAVEFQTDGYYATTDTTSGRGVATVGQRFRLPSDLTAIGPGSANIFGTNSNVSLLPNSEYEIDMELYYLKTTAGTVQFSFSVDNSLSHGVFWCKLTPTTGVPSGLTAAFLEYCTAVAAGMPVIVTSSLTTGVVHWIKVNMRFTTGASTTKLSFAALESAGTITARADSYWRCYKLPTSNTGIFAA